MVDTGRVGAYHPAARGALRGQRPPRLVEGADVMRHLDAARTVLRSLGEDVLHDRLQESREDPGFTRLTDVIHDAGRALAPREPDDARDLLPALAGLREMLEEHYSPEGIAKTPFDALRSEKATPYAAGALWATSAILYASLGRWEAEAERREEQRQRLPLRDRVLRAFERHGTMRPVDVREELAAEGRSVDKSVVSRCLGDLLAAGLITAVDPPAAKDRRHRYYKLQDQEATSRLASEKAREVAEELLALCGPEEVKGLVGQAVDEQAGRSGFSQEQQGSVHVHA